ncbi:hypothetical protein [Collinsella vaginalis]|uniref:hypothetical protein n=1 Tax=Collinsella vaginalis TaxID=1870987 RepID=UPI0015C511EB|nr:hypothetical protein [Collinsella vaginalis]
MADIENFQKCGSKTKSREYPLLFRSVSAGFLRVKTRLLGTPSFTAALPEVFISMS